MLNEKLNNLYSFFKRSYMEKYCEDLFLIIKRSSKNYLNPNNKFIYIVNYHNEDYSIYYCGKAKHLNRRISQHKMGLGPHIIGKLTDYNWNKRISEIFIFEHNKSFEFPDESVEIIEEKISKILNGIVNHNCNIEIKNNLLKQTIDNINIDIQNQKKVLVLGGGLGQSHVSDDYDYIGEDLFSGCENLENEYEYLLENKNSYNDVGETFFSGNISKQDEQYFGSLNEMFSSDIIEFEDIIGGTNSNKDKKDSSILKEHFGRPSSDNKNNMFKIFQFGKERAGLTDHATSIMNKIVSKKDLSEEEILFMKNQIYNVLFNYMLHLRNCYRGILLINFAISFGDVDIKKLNFYISTEEIKKYIDNLSEETLNFVLSTSYNRVEFYEKYFSNRGRFLKFINFLIIDKNEDFIIQEFKTLLLNNESCQRYFEEEISKIENFGGENEIEFAIMSLMKISSGDSFESFSQIDPQKTSFHFYGKIFKDNPESRNFLKKIKEIYKIKRKKGIPYGHDDNLKNIVIRGLVLILKENYEFSKNSIENILTSKSLYSSIHDSFYP